MIRVDYYRDEELKDYEAYGIEKTEVISTQYGDRKYVTFGKGLVVGYGDQYLGDGDSVWFVRIWNPVTKREHQIGMGYVNMNPQENVDVQYDATPEVKAEWEAWKAEQEAIRAQKEKAYEEAQRKYFLEQEAQTPTKGKYVKVVKGRKVPKGTIGEVFWRGQNQWGWSVGLELANGDRVFTADHNVEVIKPEEVPEEVIS
jgi:hypothetical protein